jgi:prepilin-type N-terminal cleavage/methylation domain-containing protein
MITIKKKSLARQLGFTLIELLISMAIMLTVLSVVFRFIAVSSQRSQAEQTRMDLTQEAREFVDEFERDLHEAGYPGCRLFLTGGNANCLNYNGGIGVYSTSGLAAGLVRVTNYEVGFEGDVEGDGVVESVWYRVFDSAGNFPPTGSCPCTIRRYQAPKVNGTPPLNQVSANAAGNALFTRELQNVINSGTTPANNSVYGGGLPIAGNTLWGQSNTSYYASQKDFPVFTAFDQNGQSLGLPLDISMTSATMSGPKLMAQIKSIKLTISIVANANTGYDLKTHVLPLMTLVGNGRIANCPLDVTNNCN